TYSSATTFWLTRGTYHTVAVSTLQSGTPGVRYRFTSWSDGGAASHVVAFTASTSIEANFSAEYYLAVNSSVSGASGSGWYDAGSPATAILSTTMESSGPGARFLFVGWSDDASGTAPTSNPIVMDAAKVATAIWTTQYELQVVTAYGEVSGQGWYDAGSTAVGRLALGVVPLTAGTRAA